MAEIRPFCGWRYETGQVGSLANVVAPPCDHISDELRDALYEKHECNVVRLTLNRPQSGDEPGSAAQRAAQALRHWTFERRFVPDHEAALYVLHQEFEHEGNRFVRRGFIARVRANDKVHTHESTHAEYERNRLAVREATGFDLSPIIALYRDGSNSVQEVLDEAARKITALEVTDTAGVINRMWAITNHETIGLVTSLLSDENVYVADGHHRFAAAQSHGQQSQPQSDSGAKPVEGEDSREFVMMHLVGSGDSGLMTLPSHQLLSGLEPTDTAQLQRAIAADFEFESAASASEAWELMQIDGRASVLGLGTADGRWVLAIAKEPGSDAAAASAFDRLKSHLQINSQTAQIRQSHSVQSAVDAVTEGSCQLACLMLPPSLDTIMQTADAGGLLSPKSTYFYPKTAAGLIFNPIR